MSDFRAQLFEYIRGHDLIRPNETIIVAFSGGADSTALLHMLCRLNEQQEKGLNCTLVAVHINHNLRGKDSDQDEQFARTFAEGLGVEFISSSVDVIGYAKESNLSIELAARVLRRQILTQAAKKHNSQKIATAHHKDDNAETLIHRLSRGTGIKGLAGIWHRRNFQAGGSKLTLIRPLLCLNRRQVEQYCDDNNLAWRHDKTNDQSIYTRNLIRQEILPALQEQSRQNLSELLNALAQSSQSLYKKIHDQAMLHWKESVQIAEEDCVIIDAQGFNQISPIVAQELLRIAYNHIDGSELKITQQHYEQMLEFAQEQSSSKMQLPCEIYFFRGYGKLIMQKISSEGLSSTIIRAEGEYKFRQYSLKFSEQPFDAAEFKKFLKTKSPFEEYFDAEKVRLPLTIRNRQTGDRFSPIGQTGAQRIGKFLIGAKIDHHQRQQIVIVQDSDGKIIWVAPHRASNQTKITPTTTTTYKLTLQPT